MSERSENITVPDILPDSNNVGIGSIVKIHYIGLGDHDDYTETVRVVSTRRGESETGIQEAPTDTPLGQALMKSKVGDIVSFYLPSSNERISVEIKGVY